MHSSVLIIRYSSNTNQYTLPAVCEDALLVVYGLVQNVHLTAVRMAFGTLGMHGVYKIRLTFNIRVQVHTAQD